MTTNNMTQMTTNNNLITTIYSITEAINRRLQHHLSTLLRLELQQKQLLQLGELQITTMNHTITPSTPIGGNQNRVTIKN